jgi:Family of unknown function (DUF6882)
MVWTDAQIDEYVEDSLNLLESLQDKLEIEYGLGHFERWDLDQEKEQLTFSNSSGPEMICKVSALGTYGNGYWKWAWANSSLVDSFSCKSKIMRKLGPLSGLEVFENEAFEADENMPWEIAGMALKEIGGLGIYCCPSESSELFVVIESITSNKPIQPTPKNGAADG